MEIYSNKWSTHTIKYPVAAKKKMLRDLYELRKTSNLY